MSTNPDGEATLEDAVIQLMHNELGWSEWADCYHEIFELPQVPGTSEVPGTSVNLGRQNRSEAILLTRLRAAMERLNPILEADILNQAAVELSRDRSTQSLVNANEEIYAFLKEGVPVRYQDGEGTWQTALVQLIDWHNPANNDFFLAQQFWITGPYHTRRPDVIGFVNGIPLLLIELKKATVKVEDVYDDNLTDYKDTSPFSRIGRIEAAVNSLLFNDDTRNAYLLLAGQVDRLFKAVLPDDRANPYLAPRAAVKAIADTIRRDMEPPDIGGVMADVEDLLDRSIAGFAIKDTSEAPFDLSRIDFDALRKQFEAGRKHTAAQKLRGRLNAQLSRLLRLNETRSELVRRFQELVDEYNNGRTGVDEFFERLLAFAKTLQEEDQRAISQNLNEEELAIYDLLLKPRPSLSKEEVKQVKQVAQQMLATLKEEKLILDWRKKQQSRAAVQLAIEEWLDQLPSAYEPPLWEQKVQSVYSHIHDNYYGNGKSVYTRLAVAA